MELRGADGHAAWVAPVGDGDRLLDFRQWVWTDELDLTGAMAASCPAGRHVAEAEAMTEIIGTDGLSHGRALHELVSDACNL